jgi:hemoglobin
MKNENIYDLLGGEEMIQKIAHTFYDVMSLLPETKELLALHPTDLSHSKEKLFMFLSGWLGGPQLFEKNFGHPRLRARHMPFKIDKSARDQWMLCMVTAFDQLQIQEPIRSELLHSLLKLADHMRNQPEAVNN